MQVTKAISWFTLLALVACGTPAQLPEKELTEFVNDPSNGLTKTIQAGSMQMKVTLRPNDFLVYQEVGKDGTKEDITEANERYNNYLYLMLSLSAGEKDALYGLSADQGVFSENLQVLSFRMGEHVTLTTSKQDTIPVGDYIFNRTFGLSKSNDLMFVFNQKKIPEEGWVSFNIGEFGMSSGRRNFRFAIDAINSVPKLEELEILKTR
ncbi:MAG: hypothetical protein GY816_11725 [Cytophagales bacterium]|nr:hypothetical protein [Cytophagales bacterium]